MEKRSREENATEESSKNLSMGSLGCLAEQPSAVHGMKFWKFEQESNWRAKS